MAEVVHDAQQEFWRPPSVLDAAAETKLPSMSSGNLADTCQGCGREFMIGARFCHACGLNRPVLSKVDTTLETAVADISGALARSVATTVAVSGMLARAWRQIEFPGWLYYLHFHEIKRRVGLPTAALVAFMIGLGCVGGALGVSFFYHASNLAEFQAIQMWRIEWLLAATASFVAGILLKNPSNDRD
ncbi:MAG: hypothetical protein WCC37_23835 [Candidatus Sulfotelmatobacter sp.]|jgi:hypothetical protein